MNRFKDREHLIRIAALFLVGTTIILCFRAWFIPKSFGQYGHYRGDSITEVAALPVIHAGHETCEACHAEVLAVKSIGRHAGVNCEACHGPLGKHAEDPSIKPTLPDTSVLCARCHEANTAKPKWFPAVNTKDHANGLPCNTCHQPHSPRIAAETPAVAKGQSK